MVLDEARSLLNDAAEKTREAVGATEDATENEEEEELESEFERKMRELEEQYSKKLAETVFSKLDNQEWDQAEKLAREEGNVGDDWSTVVESYVSIRLKQGQRNLAVIRYQLRQAENFISQAEDSQQMSVFESVLKKAIGRYKKIEDDELLEAQRHIGVAEQAAKYYGDAVKNHKIFALEHQKVNELDKDIESAEEDLRELIEMVES